MLLEVARHDIQPIIYDVHNFQKNKALLFENDQLNKVMAKNPLLKDFEESVISKPDLHILFYN